MDKVTAESLKTRRSELLQHALTESESFAVKVINLAAFYVAVGKGDVQLPVLAVNYASASQLAQKAILDVPSDYFYEEGEDVGNVPKKRVQASVTEVRTRSSNVGLKRRDDGSQKFSGDMALSKDLEDSIPDVAEIFGIEALGDDLDDGEKFSDENVVGERTVARKSQPTKVGGMSAKERASQRKQKDGRFGELSAAGDVAMRVFLVLVMEWAMGLKGPFISMVLKMRTTLGDETLDAATKMKRTVEAIDRETTPRRHLDIMPKIEEVLQMTIFEREDKAKEFEEKVEAFLNM
jgi:hypothetical protein